ncbi:Putative isomerase yddE, PhzC-PhzF family [Mariniradius saccharolyticus AK6]|uniref:Isomerase yddE, PhzC-PhzF family n=1 Tax=Mariniradius saccharolyticus AK6 TaxID=1239962 RepID=M7XVG0_9BACT|nr:PhzF family phenazine biosynthesis protein [Mariniradius saccharolyticus]EMS32472.1 Putative isomerase yddE, PhzC-PhzF family [Mariniradius saccharolyticus AK6]
MKTLKIYQVDAFAERRFEGNPAAVVPLTEWLSDTEMLQIAMENNLSETAFYIVEQDQIFLRWFTPAVEVDLCGHATLATAHVLFQHEGFVGEEITFFSPRSGLLKVKKEQDLLTLDFPADKLESIELDKKMLDAFDPKPIEAHRGKTDWMFVFENESQIRDLEFDLAKISEFPVRGVIATARGKEFDFVSRFFAPQSGVPEDPVTGSAHTTLTPFWAERLGKHQLQARQISARGGNVSCVWKGDRVLLGGKAVTYLIGEIFI